MWGLVNKLAALLLRWPADQRQLSVVQKIRFINAKHVYRYCSLYAVLLYYLYTLDNRYVVRVVLFFCFGFFFLLSVFQKQILGCICKFHISNVLYAFIISPALPNPALFLSFYGFFWIWSLRPYFYGNRWQSPSLQSVCVCVWVHVSVCMWLGVWVSGLFFFFFRKHFPSLAMRPCVTYS